MSIKVFDKELFGDDVLGETRIDLQERYFDESYRKIKHQPLEKRVLRLYDEDLDVGHLNLWVEMYPMVNEREKRSQVVKRLEKLTKEEYDELTLTEGNKRLSNAELKDKLREQMYPDPRKWDISPLPSKDFELRVVVWQAKHIPASDLEDMTDAFIKVLLTNLNPDFDERTDTHIRISDGFVTSPLTLGFLQLALRLPDQSGRFFRHS
jgi:hypothetical protein